jgi:hypothetical protein
VPKPVQFSLGCLLNRNSIDESTSGSKHRIKRVCTFSRTWCFWDNPMYRRCDPNILRQNPCHCIVLTCYTRPSRGGELSIHDRQKQRKAEETGDSTVTVLTATVVAFPHTRTSILTKGLPCSRSNLERDRHKV